MGVDIVAFDPLDAGRAALFAGWQAVYEASARLEYGDDHDAYSTDEIRAVYAHQQDERLLAWAAVVDDRVVGSLDVHLPIKDNRHRIEIQLAVHPDHRRRGVGT